jgi:hypothetical protein
MRKSQISVFKYYTRFQIRTQGCQVEEKDTLSIHKMPEALDGFVGTSQIRFRQARSTGRSYGSCWVELEMRMIDYKEVPPTADKQSLSGRTQSVNTC